MVRTNPSAGCVARRMPIKDTQHQTLSQRHIRRHRRHSRVSNTRRLARPGAIHTLAAGNMARKQGYLGRYELTTKDCEFP
ncbi:hypothetical protein VFPFJ_11208 [Purpureocillium lilacinum]|uniref:Uncharacterized protein n=1 Tax=Purpureocillium lilacinum TaxID=33203 RepID=A0A179FKV5_PURLI|nr:hypothetical protein VFPFJ_11208 [Purpureocillium lilacinum]OAQ65673.1 hypothetical protein VFPFJ_11208 [Purpureocillium lilacinum]OAQ78210.1 hypothetical protein VFPBJ_06329 [Purpureocillium lilacinum]